MSKTVAKETTYEVIAKSNVYVITTNAGGAGDFVDAETSR